MIRREAAKRWRADTKRSSETGYSAFAPSEKEKKSQPAATGKGIKKGFFDAPRRKKAPAGKSRDDPDVVEVKAAKKSAPFGAAKPVPEFMKIDPNSDEAQLRQMKEKMKDAMKPTPDMMKTVFGNQDLMSGFDDPTVMAAVNDIASNPQNINKYKDNPKVMKFYQNMAKTMAQRCETLAEEEERVKGKSQTKQQRPPEPKQEKKFVPVIEEL